MILICINIITMIPPNVILPPWSKSFRTLNWNRPKESITRWRVLKLFDQGGISIPIQIALDFIPSIFLTCIRELALARQDIEL